jgi:hypothetical protein
MHSDHFAISLGYRLVFGKPLLDPFTVHISLILKINRNIGRMAAPVFV